MPLLPFFVGQSAPRAWSVARAAAFGALLGALAAALKVFGPLHGSGGTAMADGREIAAAALGFAALCAGVAALRNLLLRRFGAME